jgi:NAD(P)-dependent dehydrogenase (short-subunit alcohol dehydrogenase family)
MSSQLKVALVTGAGTGIGRAVSIALINAGYAVVLTGRRLELLEETASLSKASEQDYLCVSCDVGDPKQVEHLFSELKQKYSKLDLLFNNAGVSTPKMLMEDISYEQWRSVIDTNLTGVFLCSQQAIRIMKSQTPVGGRIINNGSISAHAPRPFSAPYTSTKHAMTGLTKSIALDGREHDIVCSQIDIGNAATPLTKNFPKGVPQANGTIQAEPVIDVEKVAQAIVQMAVLPLEINVQFMTLMATKMPYIGRG